MVLDVQVHDRSVDGGGEQVERVGGIAGDDDDVAVTGAGERRDLAAGRLSRRWYTPRRRIASEPRCTLESSGSSSAARSATARSAGALAASSRFT